MTNLTSMHDQIPLGKTSQYSDTYDASLLVGIPRSLTRDSLTINGDRLPFQGCDLWTAFELSWLTPNGVPVAYIARFYIPAYSINIIESKSFKLYLNSFSGSSYPSADTVKEIMLKDLSNCAQGSIGIELDPIESTRNELQTTAIPGHCVDSADAICSEYEPNAELLVTTQEEGEFTQYSNLLKSNCPVTGQPDWGTLWIKYTGKRIADSALLQYVVSFRNHQDFHEHCAEHVFLDIMERCKPDTLEVYARYTRRGGLDINPFRSTESNPKLPEWRTVRQ